MAAAPLLLPGADALFPQIDAWPPPPILAEHIKRTVAPLLLPGATVFLIPF